MKALPILLVLLMLWSAIWRPGPGDYVARELELELPTAQTTDTYDDHGGFHGDGLLHTELTFSPLDGAGARMVVSAGPAGGPGGQHVPAILIQLHPGGVRQRRRHPVLSGI